MLCNIFYSEQTKWIQYVMYWHIASKFEQMCLQIKFTSNNYWIHVAAYNIVFSWIFFIKLLKYIFIILLFYGFSFAMVVWCENDLHVFWLFFYKTYSVYFSIFEWINGLFDFNRILQFDAESDGYCRRDQNQLLINTSSIL